MSVVISHQSGIEFFRNLRAQFLPRPNSMHDWLAAPERGIRLLHSGGIDLLTGQRMPSGPGSTPLLSAAECERVVQQGVMVSEHEAAALRRGISALAETTSTLHLLVGSRERRHWRKRVACHLSSCELWDGALWKISDGVYVCSPELLFIQMARTLARPLLVRLGMELSGGYSIQPRRECGFSNAYAVTTPNLLARHIAQAGSVRGAGAASIAVRRVLANAASPAESNGFIVFCFPRKEGGYELPLPTLNGKVDIGMLDGRKHERYCDMLFEELGIALEYLGADFHANWPAVQNDAARQGELAMRDIRVIPITKEHVASIARLDSIAESIERAGALRRRPPTDAFRQKQLELHSMIYPWAH